ncbi:hypothetical protein DRP04_15495 [Archaeoglobales archaeon]|nr:MAG: hypothetical protein DRP04_15495 [Archaeoglobales archaeon]
MLKCPLCDYTAKTFQALKIHIHKYHRPDGECPICGQKVKSLLRHLSNQSHRCEKHRLLYALCAEMRQCSTNESKIRIRELRDWAENVLEVRP